MKKLFLFNLLIFGFLLSVSAQFEIKGLVGTNFSNLTKTESGVDISPNAGYQFGAGLLIGEKFYVEPGIQFVRNTKTFSDPTDEVTFYQNFVKIPVYAGYHLLGHESGPVALRVFAGPAAMIAGSLKGGEDKISKDDIQNALFLADVGVGLDVLFLFVELNYEYAFNSYWTDEALDANHTGFLINAGIHLDF